MHFGDNTMKISEVLNSAKPVSESIDKNFFHTSVENGKFMKHELGGLNDPAILYLHDLDNKGSDGKSPMLVTFAQQADAEEARKQYGGKIIRSGMDTFRIIKDGDDLDETTSSGAMAVAVTPIGGKSMIQKRNPDGTAKNALDGDTLMASKKKKSKRKKA